MTVAETLARVGVTPADQLAALDCTVFQPDAARSLRVLSRSAGPALVSCLMTTSGQRASIRFALECYRRQLYQHRELVIVTYRDRVRAVEDVVAELGIATASVHGVGRDLALGEMRNVSVGRARGEILIQWDDDDLYDPARISVAGALLTQTTAAATLLWRVLLWWPEREMAAISVKRLWEPTVAYWRDHAPVYPSLNREEDTRSVAFVASTRPVVGCDQPLNYVYVVHGRNTCETEHFEGHFEQASCVLRGEAYAELLDMLAARMPVRDYRGREDL